MLQILLSQFHPLLLSVISYDVHTCSLLYTCILLIAVKFNTSVLTIQPQMTHYNNIILVKKDSIEIGTTAIPLVQ